MNQLNFGRGLATTQSGIPQTTGANIANLTSTTGNNIADLMTGIGAVQAGGIVGSANAQNQGSSNLLNTILTGIGGGFGDFGGILGSSSPPPVNAGTGVMNTDLTGLFGGT